MADKYQAGGQLLADSEEYLTGKDATFSGTVTAGGFQTPGGNEAGAYPTGTVMWWPTDTPPSGWTTCNGSAISRVDNSGLYGVIGTSFGVGDGSSTFNVPDISDDIFIRGWASSGGIDTGRTFGSEQSADVGDHSHTSAAANAPHTHTANSEADNMPHTHGFTVVAANMPHEHNANTGASNAPHKHGGTLNNTGSHNHNILRQESKVHLGNQTQAFGGAPTFYALTNPSGSHTHNVSFQTKSVPHTHPATCGTGEAPHNHGTTVGAASAPHDHGTQATADASDLTHTHGFTGGDGGTGTGNIVRPPSISMLAIIKL